MRAQTEGIVTSKGLRIARYVIGGLAVAVGLSFGLLAMFVVPAPNARSATDVADVLVSISRPSPEHGDMGIVLGNGRSYYINRANEIATFDWEKMLAEVQPGDKVYLTVVRPLAWRLLGDKAPANLPVAGVWTDESIYMDPVASAITGTAQATYRRVTLISLLVGMVCALPEVRRLSAA